MTREVVAQLPDLRFISQTSANVYHVDVAACTEHGVVVSAGRGGARTAYSTTAELTWGLIIASLRHLPFEVERLQAGLLALDRGHAPRGPDARDLRLRPHRRGGREGRPRVRHEGRVLGP